MPLIEFSQILGNLGEFFGAIAVTLTLAYLAIQVRLTKKELQRSISQARAETSRQLHQSRVDNESLRLAWMKTAGRPWRNHVAEKFDLTIDEVDILVSDLVARWQYHAHTITYVEQLRPAERAGFDNALRMQYRVPFTMEWFSLANSDGLLDQDAVEYLERLLSNE